MTGRDPNLDDPDNLRAIADDTYDWETWFSPDGRALWTNRAVRRMTGRSPEACLALPDYPLPLIVEEDRPRISQILRGAREGSSGNDVEFRLLGSDGMHRWVAMSWQRTYNRRGDWLGFRTSVRDIHDRKELELQLREALHGAQVAERAKAEFLAMMSHELRTPLQSIHGHAELLLALDPSDAQRRRLEIILGQSQTLTEQLESVLELSALDANAPQLSLGPVAVGQLTSQVCESLRPRAQRDGLPLVLERAAGDDRPVRTDARALRQVLTNLIHNAIKFTPQGSVTVRTRIDAQPPASPNALHLAIEVQDAGPGISASERERVFEPFARAQGPGVGDGTGLGLAIASRLTAALGGELQLEPVVSGGSLFRLRLRAPLSTRTETAQHGAVVATIDAGFAARHPLRILLVEDSAPARELLAELLERRGYAPVVAGTGRRACECLEANHYDLVLMDLHLPDLDGTEVLKRVRGPRDARDAHGQGAGRPAGGRVVALSAGVVGSSRQALLRAGFDAVVPKPIDGATLEHVLRWAAGDGPPPEGPRREDDDGWRAALRADVIADLDIPGPDGQRMLARVASRTLAQLPERSEAIRQAHAGGDADALQQAAHALRGDCLLVGATDAAQAAAEVESLAGQPATGAADPLPAALGRLAEEVQRLQRVLASIE